MRCFSRGSSGRSTTPAAASSPIVTPAASTSAAAAADEHQSLSSAQTSASASPTHNHSFTINLRHEYAVAVNTHSINEIWSKIHHNDTEEGEEEEGEEASDLIDRVLQPERSSIQEALSSARHTPLTRLVKEYLDTSEHTSHLFLSLRRSLNLARSLYSPIADLLDLLPSSSSPASSSLSQSQSDWALQTLQQFEQAPNPFSSCSFDAMRLSFSQLKIQLDSRLLAARRTRRVLRCATTTSASCLVAASVAAAVSGLLLAAHAMIALVAAGPAACFPGDPLASRRRRVREQMERVDRAAREAYVLNNYLDTVERLVARLHATVESDKVLVRLGIERGARHSVQEVVRLGIERGARHSVQEVVRHLRKNHSSLLHQLRDLDRNIVLCLAAVNRARSLLFQQIHY